MQQLLKLFPPSFDYICAIATPGGTDPDWTTRDRYRLTPAELIRKWADPDVLIGLRPRRQTHKLTLDLDRSSKFHAFNNLPLHQELRDHLAKIGLHDGETIRSSESNGHHLIYVFSEEIDSFGLACAVQLHLEAGGFDYAAGQLESFPNVKAYDTDYKPVRVPFQEGSELLDLDFNPVPQSHEDNMAYLVSRIENNGNDLELLKASIRKCKRNGGIKKLSQRYARLGNTNIQKWYQDWKETTEIGWTAKGQTNDLIPIYCRFNVVFEGIIDPRELIDRVKAQIIAAPGYEPFCNHKRKIDRRIDHWVTCTLKRYYPFGQRELLGKGGEYQPAARPRSTVRTDDVIRRIYGAIELTKQWFGGLPQKMTDRLEAIMKASKELGQGLSRKTLYRACYKSLWQQAETAENRQELQTETETEFYPIQLTENTTKKDSQTPAQTEVCYIFASMKRLPILGADVTNSEVDLGGLRGVEAADDFSISQVDDFDLAEATLDDGVASLQQNCESSNDQLSNPLQPSSSDEVLGLVDSIVDCPLEGITAIDRSNSQLNISDLYSLAPVAPHENLISQDYDSSEESFAQRPLGGIELPAPGTAVKRRSHRHWGKDYPEVLARVVRASGLELEVITELGERYRFDLCDWLDTWFLLLE
jgi:hypothetical protein